MYSRNMRMNSRSGISERETTREQKKNERNYPPPPPNYRGMVYRDIAVDECDVCPEGIDRIVCNDDDYSEKMKKRGLKCVLGDECVQKKEELTGINAIVDGLSSKRFDPEDLLVSSMILLMLNDGSGEDILMILVLLMLL